LSCGSPAIAALDGRAESRRLRRDSVGTNHRLGAAQIPQSRLQMCLVTYRNNEPKVSGVQGGLVIHVHMGDVRFGVGQLLGDPCEYALAVDDGHNHPGFEQACRFVCPVHGNEAFAVFVLQALGHTAISVVYDQPLAAAQATMRSPGTGRQQGAY